MKKIISIVLNNFKNDSRVLKENISLYKAGYDVKIVALHDGLSSLQEFDETQGISIHRIKLHSKNWSKNALIQLFKYIEYVYKVIKQYGRYCDIVHCNDLSALPIGVMIKKICNKYVKIVYDAHEYETEKNGSKGFRKKLLRIVERKCIKYADSVITVSDSIANDYVKLYNIKKPVLILNTPKYEDIIKKNIFRKALGIEEDKIIFVFQGALSFGRGIELLLDTFKLLNNKKIVIVFMGYGELENLVKEASVKYDNIYFHPAVSFDVLLGHTSSADFGILAFPPENTCLSYQYSLPNKMFEYLMAGIPFLSSNLYEMKKFVENNKVGCVANNRTSNGIIEAVEKIIKLDKKELTENIQKIKNIYCWEEQEKILINLYNKL